MNLYEDFRRAFDLVMCVNPLVVWEIGIGKVEFDYECSDFALVYMQR